MQQLTPEGLKKINELSQKYQVSNDAVMTLLQALINGNGSMAQFNHPELGGSGQWMSGGMTMVGDMFNNALKATVDGLCIELSNLLMNQNFTLTSSSSQFQSQGGQQQGFSGNYSSSSGNEPVSLFVPSTSSGHWWPNDLGSPTATGAQNQVRYAYFANSRRLAIDINGQVSVYDTLDHQIGGVSQQQGGGSSVIFTSQYGTVDVLNLPIISGPGTLQKSSSPTTSNAQPVNTNNPSPTDIFATIERLAELKEKGLISEEEFATKKSELLERL